MAEILNVDHTSVNVFKEGRYRWLLVANYRDGRKAVVFRKSELYGFEQTPRMTEFVISTIEPGNDDHLKRVMRYACSMFPDVHSEN